MDKGVSKLLAMSLFLLASQTAFAQGATNSGSTVLMYTLIAIVVVLFLFFIITAADNLLRIEAKAAGVDKDGANYSIFPSRSELFGDKVAGYAGDDVTVLKKGHDILLQGEAQKVVEAANVTTFAVQPPNFIGISPIPKVTVAVGEEVKAGDVVFFDKKRPEIKYVAPVSGEIVAVNRGAKRSIKEVVILADKEQKSRALDRIDLGNVSRKDLVDYLLESGAWVHIRQRPYDVVADPNTIPKAVFVSTFDTAPLAPDANLVVEGRTAAFQKGLDVLNKLADTVHLGLSANGKHAPAAAFTDANGVKKHWFAGKHPAGNVGIQIHHIDAINAGETVWTLGVQDVITLGAVFTENRYNAERIIALTGAELAEPKYVRTHIGAKIEDLVKGNLTNDHVRFVSGDVLSGKAKEKDSYLNLQDDQLTVLAEGDYNEAFGWLLPITPRPSISRTFPNFLFPDLKFKADTNTHGEKRAFVVTGQYEQVLPMDIYPQHLMKAILVNDFERMEGLGIYELSEEDVALCEFVCTSKQPLQQILREGLDTMREQG